MPGAQHSFSSRQYVFHGHSYAAVRAPPYHFYRGFTYRAFYVGQRFPAFLLLSDYFLTNYYLYNLAPPPPGAVWVRFGPDALLVNTYNGAVLDSAPGVFDDSDAQSAEAEAPPPPDDQAAADGGGYPGPNGYPTPPGGF